MEVLIMWWCVSVPLMAFVMCLGCEIFVEVDERGDGVDEAHDPTMT